MRSLPLLLALMLAACATTVRRAMPPAGEDWFEAVTAAQQAVETHRYYDADNILSDFARRHSGTPEAREASYWRALFELDPANPVGSGRVAQVRLDEYLADTTAAPHVLEAQLLRRLVLALDSIHDSHRAILTNSDSARQEQAEAAQQRQQDLQKEIHRLKEQLDKTNAELDRIKKRLSEKNP